VRVLIAGLGSIGRRHLAGLRELRPGDEVIALRHQHTNAVPLPGVDRYAFSLDEALAYEPEVALICGPASTHVATALGLARHGVHLFIEKPLSHRLDGIDELIDVCTRAHLTLMVGYNLRFLESLRALREAFRSEAIGKLMTVRAEVGQYLPDWRPQSDYRESVSARWICGEIIEVDAITARTSDLELDVEDTVEMILRFESGAVGSIHLDMVQRAPVRGCRLVGGKGTLIWDGLSDEVRLYSATRREWKDLSPPQPPNRGVSYRSELLHFFECVESGATPLVTGEDGRRIVQIVLAAEASAHERCSVSIAPPKLPAA
jgi:predicted dehydrogenase